jgi:carbonic anhydrase/acetyltransferase-like protein (isoleucine patch superfamily)
MTTIGPLPAYVGYLMKDFGTRMVIQAHKFQSRRLLKPAMRHQNIRVYRHIIPTTSEAAFVAPSAMVQGNVTLGHGASVFYHSYIRNFHGAVPTTVGDHTTVADRVTFVGQIKVGHDCFVGVGASLDCCEVMDNVFIGHGACIQLGCVLEDGCIIGHGAVLPQDTRVKANEYWAGNPATLQGMVDEKMRARVQEVVKTYGALGGRHKHAVEEHYKEGLVTDADWLKTCCDMIEKRRDELAFPQNRELPSEALRFLQPRVSARLPQMHVRMSYPVNRIAPWMMKSPDINGNA